MQLVCVESWKCSCYKRVYTHILCFEWVGLKNRHIESMLLFAIDGDSAARPSFHLNHDID